MGGLYKETCRSLFSFCSVSRSFVPQFKLQVPETLLLISIFYPFVSPFILCFLDPSFKSPKHPSLPPTVSSLRPSDQSPDILPHQPPAGPITPSPNSHHEALPPPLPPPRPRPRRPHPPSRRTRPQLLRLQNRLHDALLRRHRRRLRPADQSRNPPRAGDLHQDLSRRPVRRLQARHRHLRPRNHRARQRGRLGGAAVFCRAEERRRQRQCCRPGRVVSR